MKLLKNTILYVGVCIGHILLATYELLPIWFASVLAVVVVMSTYKFVKLDKSIVIQLLLLVMYLLNGPGLTNVVILLCSALLFWYSTEVVSEKQTLRNSSEIVHEQQQQFNETFQTVRKERHDYLKHIAAIQYLLEKDEVQEAEQYMTTIIDNYEETNLSIKGEQGAIASVLHANFKRAHADKMAINYQLEVPVSNIPIAMPQLVELVGNILENAVDACREWQRTAGQQGFVELSLRKRSGVYILTCHNSTSPVPKEVADRLFTTAGITTKPEHAGLGTMIIQEIIDHHQGFLDFTTEKNTFSITCKFPSIT